VSCDELPALRTEKGALQVSLLAQAIWEDFNLVDGWWMFIRPAAKAGRAEVARNLCKNGRESAPDPGWNPFSTRESARPVLKAAVEQDF
jgi:hypothetical protein